MRYWVWDTEELIDVVEWMRWWNERNVRKVKFYGFVTDFPAVAYKPFELPPSDTMFSGFAPTAIACDALKIAYSKTRQVVYRQAYQAYQAQVLQSIRSGQMN